MNNLLLKNKNGLNISLFYEYTDDSKPLIIFVHGFRGRMSQSLFSVGKNYLKDFGYSVLGFDATNHIGTSEGDLSDFTISEFIDDLNCVVNHAYSNYSKNIVLVSHSLGSLISILADQQNISSHIFISGALKLHTNGFLGHREFVKAEEDKLIFNHKGKIYELSMKAQLDSIKYTQEMVDKSLESNIPKIFLYMENDEAIQKNSFYESYEKSQGLTIFEIIKNSSHNPKTEIEIYSIIEEINKFLQKVL